VFYTEMRIRAPVIHPVNMGKAHSSDAARVGLPTPLRAKQLAGCGILERQFRRYYEVSLGRRGLTGLNLLQILNHA
jgi:hypothetical protein